MSDDFIAEAVENGAFRNIVCFDVEGTGAGDLSMRTVFLLLNKCNRLKTVGRLKTWSHVTRESIIHLANKVKLENLCVTILLK